MANAKVVHGAWGWREIGLGGGWRQERGRVARWNESWRFREELRLDTFTLDWSGREGEGQEIVVFSFNEARPFFGEHCLFFLPFFVLLQSLLCTTAVLPSVYDIEELRILVCSLHLLRR